MATTFCDICDMLTFVPNTVKKIVKYSDDTCVVIDTQKNNEYIFYLREHRKPRNPELEHMMNIARDIVDMTKYAFAFPNTQHRHFFFYVREFNGR